MSSNSIKTSKKPKPRSRKRLFLGGLVFCAVFLGFLYVAGFTSLFSAEYDRANAKTIASGTVASSSYTSATAVPSAEVATFDTVTYDKKLLQNANYPVKTASASSTASRKVI